MNSIRRKFYITYLLITAAGAVGLKGYAEHFRSLPLIFGFSPYAALLGLVYLIISITLLEYFVFSRIHHIKKELKRFEDVGYCTKKKINDLSGKDEIGEIVHHINDVIEKIQTSKERLRHKSSLYLSLVEDASIFVYRFRDDGTITFVNKPYADMMGLSYKDMYGKNIYEYIADSDELKRKLLCLTPKQPSIGISIDIPKIVNQPAPKWIAWNASAVFNPAGKVTEFQVVGINMHHFKESTVKKESEYDNIFLLTTEGKIAYISSINKYENVISQSFADCLHKEDIAVFLKAFKYVINNKNFAIRNVRIKKKEGFVVAQILIEASVDKKGNVNSVSVKMIDITDIEGAQARVVGAVNNMNRLLEEQASFL